MYRRVHPPRGQKIEGPSMKNGVCLQPPRSKKSTAEAESVGIIFSPVSRPYAPRARRLRGSSLFTAGTFSEQHSHR